LYAEIYADRKRDLIPYEPDQFYVYDFTLAELKTLKRRQKFLNRSQELNDKFDILTLQEVIDNVRRLTIDHPRNTNSDTPVGLYIELKNYQQNMDFIGLNMADLLNEVLRSNGLGTKADCLATKMPIIIQSFELPALYKYELLSDLPLVFLVWYTYETPDWEEVSKLAHGVGVGPQA